MIVILLILSSFFIMYQDCSNISFQINENFFHKNPLSSDLGKKIIQNGIELIHELGFDKFNFKLLSQKIETSESSIYRYFKNKQMLLLYLSDWFWSWKEYQLVINTSGINNNYDKLLKAVKIITSEVKNDHAFEFVNEQMLFKIMASDFFKVFLSSNIDEHKNKGYFAVYQRLHQRLSEIILAYNQNFKYPKNLASTIIEGSLQGHFFSHHFKSIIDQSSNNQTDDYYQELVIKTLKSTQ